MQDQPNKTLKNLFRTAVVILVVGALAMGSMAFISQAEAKSSLLNVVTQTDEPEDTTTDNTETTPPDELGGFHPIRPGRHGFNFGPGSGIEYDAYLAEALGIPVEELEAAYDAADQAMLAEAVEQGLITEDEAAMISAVKALRDYIDREAITAEALGITVEELQAAREEGKSVRDLIDELGLDADTVKADTQTAYENAVQQAVDEGILTQEQADQILSHELRLPSLFVPGRPDGRGGPGGRGSFGPCCPPCPPTEDAPATDTVPDSDL
ncbi:MAG: hypothetical protein JW726_16755 [Anaerolineales bacterium]|nr:hypothetical protein [Anaerolineales bacterium]